jgi:hypothetical protein
VRQKETSRQSSLIQNESNDKKQQSTDQERIPTNMSMSGRSDGNSPQMVAQPAQMREQ